MPAFPLQPILPPARRVTLNVLPVPKPRMTRRDVWLSPPRAPVARYRMFCDELRAEVARLGFELPEGGASLRFDLPMPASWSRRKRAEMMGRPHQQRPDLSNIVKAFEDGLLAEDCRIWHYAGLEKRWGETGAIHVVIGEPPE